MKVRIQPVVMVGLVGAHTWALTNSYFAHVSLILSE